MVSKLWEATAPEATGGTGAAVGYLVRELQRRGHEITLFASTDSQAASLVAERSAAAFRQGYSEPIEYLNIAAAFDRRRNFDLIHCHNEYKSLFFGAASPTPSLHTVRYGEFFADERLIFERYRQLNFAGISNFIKGMLPDLNWQGIVPNGLDVSLFPYQEQKEGYLLFLARLSPQKGPDAAIRVAKKLGKKLIMAGKRTEHDAAYLAEKVDPFIDGEQIVYVGEADFSTKAELLAGADCLLHPIVCPEAFGMALIEAMACGTPVIAYDRGAVKEVLAAGETGFIVSREEEMAAAVGRLGELKPGNCRARVENYFSVAKMADGYEKIYRQIV